MIQEICRRAFEKKVFPGIVLLIEKDDTTVLSVVEGFSQVFPVEEKMAANIWFDLASVTKSLATATSFLALCERNSIGLEKSVGYFLPEVNPKMAEITLFQLLTHTSCLPPIPEIFKLFMRSEDLNRNRALSHLYSLIPEGIPGQEVIYSCTGYILLTRILESVSGSSLSRVFSELITEPGNLPELVFNPDEEIRNRSASTEYCIWRDRWIKGEVHDENSYCLGGEGGNAGLFGTASGVSGILNLFTHNGVLNGKQILVPETVRMMISCLTPGLSPSRSLGFLTQDEVSFAGPGFSTSAFGHTGFTGTSVWIDPELDLKVIALTNRVHYGRDNTADEIKEFRKELHQQILSDFS